MRPCLSSRLIFLFMSLLVPIGSHLADYSRTHIFNPKWTPHAKFHTGQTLAFSIFLSVMTVWFSWRYSSDLRTSVFAATGFASAYWLCQTTAVLYPGTSFFDPETHKVYILGLPGQGVLGVVALLVVALAGWLGLHIQPNQ